MHLEYILRQIEANCNNIRHDRSPFCGSLQTHLGTSMPSGGGYIIRASLGMKHTLPFQVKTFIKPRTLQLHCLPKYHDNKVSFFGKARVDQLILVFGVRGKLPEGRSSVLNIRLDWSRI